MFYLHFWTKDGQLERVPFETVEEAVAAGWAFEKSERLRMNPNSDERYLHRDNFAGAVRDRMTTIITDENNEGVETDGVKVNGTEVGSFFNLRHFLFSIKHNQYFFNEHHWASHFEAKARGLTPENIVCPPDRWSGGECFNCRNAHTNRTPEIATRAFQTEDAVTYLDRDQQVVQLFKNGMSRKEIAALSNLTYHNVCRIIRENMASA